MNYATNVSNPTAHVTKRKSRLKVYGGVNVYMNDGESFEIELHNPKTKLILAKIKLNGNYISDGGIVIKPGQRVFLERFLDSNNKFVFSTYEVKNTRPNEDAIAFNGNVEVEFYDEQEIRHSFLNLNGRNLYNSGLTYGRSSGDYIPQFGTTISTTGGVGYNTTTTTYNTSNATYTSSVTMDSLGDFEPSSMLKSKSVKKGNIETGRIEKGESSKQNFETVSEQFNPYICHKVVYKILPTGTKNIEVDEIRNYCPECGKKQKKEHKFCPSCGTKL
jgi:hypothetical protein